MALDDVSIEIPAGETFGLIGENGSRQEHAAQVHRADPQARSPGPSAREGKISALLELGAGFHPELSGRDNVYLNGAILGLSKKQLDARFDDIVGFAGLEHFIDTPVKNYSSGMYVRLGFSVAINVDPDILLVDEVLAVGDEEFQRRCSEKFAELKHSGKTVVIVSHALGSVRNLCDEVALLEHGKLIAIGPAGEVIDGYLVRGARRPRSRTASTASRWGSGEGKIEQVEILDRDGAPDHGPAHRRPDDDPAPLRARASRSRSRCSASRSRRSRASRSPGRTPARPARCPDQLSGTGHVDLRVDRLMLAPGTYDLSVSLYDYTCSHAFDFRYRTMRFDIERGDPIEEHGVDDPRWHMGRRREPGAPVSRPRPWSTARDRRAPRAAVRPVPAVPGHRRAHRGVRRSPPGSLVLEVGGGPGPLETFLPELEVFVSDITGEHVGRFMLADGAALPFADQTFAAVVTLDVLEHVPAAVPRAVPRRAAAGQRGPRRAERAVREPGARSSPRRRSTSSSGRASRGTSRRSTSTRTTACPSSSPPSAALGADGFATRHAAERLPAPLAHGDAAAPRAARHRPAAPRQAARLLQLRRVAARLPRAVVPPRRRRGPHPADRRGRDRRRPAALRRRRGHRAGRAERDRRLGAGPATERRRRAPRSSAASSTAPASWSACASASSPTATRTSSSSSAGSRICSTSTRSSSRSPSGAGIGHPGRGSPGQAEAHEIEGDAPVMSKHRVPGRVSVVVVNYKGAGRHDRVPRRPARPRLPGARGHRRRQRVGRRQRGGAHRARSRTRRSSRSRRTPASRVGATTVRTRRAVSTSRS